jgi:hypothetical protein
VTDRSARPAVPSRRSFVVGWKAFRCFDDELGIVPSYSADAPALRVLELEDRRRDAHRRCADDDMEAPSVADDCSDLEHGRRHTPNACAGKESAASAARSIPGSEACPPGERVVVPPKRDTVSRARETRLRRAAGRRVYRAEATSARVLIRAPRVPSRRTAARRFIYRPSLSCSCFGIVRADRAGAQLAQMLERVDAGRVSVAPVEADCIPAHRVDRERPDILADRFLAKPLVP